VKVLIVAEGEHESSGALQTLIERLTEESHTYTVRRLKERGIGALHGRGRGFYKRAVRWLLEAQKHHFAAIVLLVDEDGYTNRVSEVNAAQDEPKGVPRRALGVAIRSFDAWMLADESALQSVLGLPIQRQADPESQRRPKEQCESLLAQANHPMPQREMYANISGCVDLSALEARCPRGFAPFAQRVRALAT